MKNRGILQRLAIVFLIGYSSTLQGGILDQLFYDGVFNSAGGRSVDVADLRDFPDFPDNPIDILPLGDGGLTTPRGQGDDYGSLIKGYIQAPETGDYTIFSASDDGSEFLLSTDHDPVNLQLITVETGCCTAIFSGARLDERSGTVSLEKGVVYYFEAVYKEGGGGDWMDVGWEKPDGSQEIIPQEVLMPFPRFGASAPIIVVDAIDAFVNEGGSARLAVDVEGSQPMTFQWKKNGANINGENLAYLNINEIKLSDEGAIYTVDITNSLGNASSFGVGLFVEPDFTPPVVTGVRGSGFPKGILVNFSESVDESTATNASNYSISGQDLEIFGVELLSVSSVLLQVVGFNTDPMKVSISNIKDRSAAGNTIASGTSVDIRFISTPVDFPEGLVGYWDFNEGSGLVANDQSGNGYNGDLIGQVVFINDADRGGVISLGGNDSYVMLNAIPELVDMTALTVSIWFNREVDDTSTPTNHNIDNVLLGHSANATNDDFELGTEGSNIQLYLDTTAQDGGNPSIDVDAGIVDNTWYHVAYTFDAADSNESKVYLNGSLINEYAAWGGAFDGDPATPWTIGIARPDGSLWGEFIGRMDDVAIWTIALTQDQISAFAASGATGLLTITQQPQSKTVAELKSVTFSAAAEGSDPVVIGYQWSKNGVPIPGAVSSSYTISTVSTDDDGSLFTVVVFNTNGAFDNVLSEEATLTVTSDDVAPKILSARGVAGTVNEFVIEFDEPLDVDSATEVSNYTIAGLTVSQATLDSDNVTVTLRTSAQTNGDIYTVNIQNVGDISPSGNAFSGSLDIKSAISYPAEILADGPSRYWRFDETSGTAIATIATDLDPLDVGTGAVVGANLNAPSLVLSEPGNSAVSFDASSGNRIDIPDGNDLNAGGPWEQRTIEFWLQAGNLPLAGADAAENRANRQIIYEEGGSTRGLAIYLSGTQDADPTEAELHFIATNLAEEVWGGQSGLIVDGSTDISVIIQTGVTYHVAYVMIGDPEPDSFNGTLTVYINGEEVGQVSGVHLFYAHTDDIGIGGPRADTVFHDGIVSGAGGSGLYFFDGTLDEFAVYPTALPIERIAAHYEAGITALELPEIVSAKGSGNPKGIVVNFAGPVDADVGGAVGVYSISGQDLVIDEAVILDDLTVLLKVAEFNNDPMILKAGSQTVTIGLGSTLEAYWNFNEGDGEETADLAGDHPGTLMGADGLAAWTDDTPTLPGGNPFAISFDGVDDYVFTEYAGVGGSNPRTVSFWVKTTATTTHGLVAWGDSSRNATKYHIRVNPGTGTIRTEVQGGNNWGTTSIVDDQWHHVVSLVPDIPNVNNLDVLHYVDGALETRLGGGDEPINTDISGDLANPVSIGLRIQGGAQNFNHFAGLIDDVSIFEGALTAEQIAELGAGVSPLDILKPTGELSFSAEPQDTTVLEFGTVTLSGAVNGTGAIGYQWYENGVARAGATGSSLTLTDVSFDADGTTYSLEAYNQNGTFNTIQSADIALTVDAETDPPQVVAVKGTSGGVDEVQIDFNEPLDEASATDTGNYSIAGLTVNSAAVSADGFKVFLSTGAQTTDEEYTLSIQGVKDQSVTGNELNGEVSFTSSFVYADLVLFDGPSAYWEFGASDDDTAADTLGVGIDGTYASNSGAALPESGVNRLVKSAITGAVSFTAGNDQLITLPDHVATNIGGPYSVRTIDFWFQANALPTDPGDGNFPDKMVIFEEGGTTRGSAIYLSGTQSGSPTEADLYFHIWNIGETAATGGEWGRDFGVVEVHTTIQIGVVYHAAMVMEGDDSGFNSGTLTGYLNGEQIGEPAFGVGLLYNHTDNAGFGAVNGNVVFHDEPQAIAYGFPFVGVIDEFAIYNRILSPERIAAHYEAGLVEVEIPVDPGDLVFTEVSTDGNEVTVTWEGGGQLQSADDVEGPYQDVAGASSPHSDPLDPSGRKFYRVVR